MITRRQFAAASAMLAAVHPGHSAFGQAADGGATAANTTPSHDMSAMPAHWTGKEQIAFLIYPEFTALDMVGPHHMLTGLMGATTHVVAKTREIVKSDTGLMFQPSASFNDCPADLDIICVPGGAAGTLAAMQDEATISFLKDRGSRAKFVTSVCTGSLLLGAAGLLKGYRATSHWTMKPLLPIFDAIPAEGRVVRDRNRITGGGVTAGIDFGLSLVGQLRDRTCAEFVQLLAEYAPEPPYDAGSPQRASAEVNAMMDDMFADFKKRTEGIAREIYARRRNG